MSKIIAPVKSERLTTGGVSAPIIQDNSIDLLGKSVMSSLSLYNDLENREKKLKLNNQKNLVDLYLLNKEDENLQYNSLTKTDSNYKNNTEKFNAFSKQQKTSWENFYKIAKEQGIDDTEIEKVRLQANSIDLKTDTTFKTKYTEYLEKENKKSFFLATEGKREVARNLIASGQYNDSVKTFQSFSDNVLYGTKEGHISPQSAIDEIRTARGNMVEGGAIAIADKIKTTTSKEEQLKSLDNIYNWTFEQFSEEFKELNYKKGNLEIPLNDDDYKKFRSQIKQQQSLIKTKGKAEEQALKWEEVKLQNDIKNNPVKFAYKEGGYLATTPTYEVLDKVSVQATNNKYGTDFKTFDDLLNSDTPIVTIQKGYNDKLSIYNDFSIEPSDLIQNRVKEGFEFAGGQDEEIQKRIMNNQYSFDDAPAVPTYEELNMYNEGKGFDTFYNTLYSTANREFLSLTNKSKVRDNIDGMLENFTVERTRVNFQDNMYAGVKKNVITSLGSTLSVFRNGAYYDPEQKFLLTNITQRVSDLVKVHANEENGGILGEDIAEKLKLEKKAGLPIPQLTPNEQTKLFNYYIENPSKDLKENVNKAISYYTENYKTVDTGYGMINIDKNLYSENIGKSIGNVITTTQFYTKEGKLIPKKRVVPVFVESNKKIGFAYKGQQVLINSNDTLVPFRMDLGGAK